MAKGQPVSPLMLDEALASQDERFVDLLRNFHDPKRVATIADRWARDHRPWAREKIISYLSLPLDVPGHEPLIKRLFKYAESQKDDALIARFLRVFDRLIRRVRKQRYRYDWKTRQSWSEDFLYTPVNRVVAPSERSFLMRFGPNAGKELKVQMPGRSGILFSNKTRLHLRRRAWRYFRRIGFQDPKRYLPAITRALVLYEDDDLAAGENIIDSWGLMHACFGESDIIEFTPSLTRVVSGKKFADLSAAPVFPELWQARDAIEPLFVLVGSAKSRLVRVFAMQLLRRWHQNALDGVAIERLITLLDHPDSEVQQFAAELFSNSPSLGTLPVETWLRLLGTKNITALELIVTAMEKHVAPERLNLAQLVTLACARPVPVARLAMRYLSGRTVSTADDREIFANLSAAQCESVGAEIARFALGILGMPEHYDPDQVVRFFDSMLVGMRQAAWEWLVPTASGWNDPRLWSRLIESPYDDIRLRLVQALQHRAAMPGADATAHAALWGSVLLGIHRGGRTKLMALRQISDAIRNNPEDAERLIPVLAVAIRSVRLPEARGGLAAIVSAIDARPQLEGVVARYLPELKLNVPGAKAGVA
jgi:hypothetical protein